jgi:hypothetical protein
MRAILASAALCLGLSACVSTGPGPSADGSIPVTITISPDLAAKALAYCAAHPLGVPLALAAAQGASSGIVHEGAVLTASVIGQVCSPKEKKRK